ncbi:MAG: protein kinase [Candidatus Hydrogenedentes bacterium]|nr:protein kinase [Candidatus Hydrogenedentota bacterium]
MQEPGRERHVLFTLAAFRLRAISPALVGEALAVCAAAPDRMPSRSMLEKGLIDADQCRSIERMVEDLLRSHRGDTGAAISSLGGLESLTPAPPAESGGVMNTMTLPIETMTLSMDSADDAPAVSADAVQEAPGRYTHVAHYAEGGMGRILLVHDAYLGRSVALKELIPPEVRANTTNAALGVRQSDAMAARFLQEARITGQLEHPSIVPIHELGRRADGTLYYTMKLVKGKTLGDALRERTTLRGRLELLHNFVDLCQAVAYAHSRGVIHRDIKPANVMIGDFGETVVLDWGLAKTKNMKAHPAEGMDDMDGPPEAGAAGKTMYGRAVGTPQYMSPEQAKGQLDKIDERSDVYSLGAVLYQILTGVPPFSGDNTRDIMDRVIRSQPAPPARLVADTPPELAGICEKALRKPPEERYQSAAELAEDVQRFITGRLVLAYDYSPREILARYYRRHRAVINIAAAAALLLVAVLSYTYASMVRARNREHTLRVATEAARENEAQSRAEAERTTYITQLALMQEHIQSQDYATANRIAREVDPKQRNWEWGFLLNRANPELLTVTTSQPMVASVTVSPDATRVASVASPGPVQLWDMETGELRATCEGDVPPFGAPCEFSPDGKNLVWAGQDGAVRVWETGAGRLVHTLRGHVRAVSSAQFSTDGREIVTASTDGTVRFWDLQTGAATTTLDANMGPLSKALFSPGGNTVVIIAESGQIKAVEREGLAERFSIPGEDAVFSADGTLLAVSRDDTIHLLDAQSGSVHQQFKGVGKIFRMRFGREGGILLAAFRDGNARLWDTRSGELICVYPHNSPLLDTAFARGDTVVVTCGFSNDFAAWDTETGNLLNRMSGRGRVLNNVSFSYDGRRMVNACSEGSFQIWDPLYQRGRSLLSHGEMSYSNFAVADETNMVAIYRYGLGIGLFSVDCNLQNTLFMANPTFATGYNCMDFSPDGKMIALITDCFTPFIWNITFQNSIQLIGHDAAVNSVSFSNSGQQAVTASKDSRARIWDITTGREKAILRGHEAEVTFATFSPDDRLILTGSGDGTAGLWDAHSTQRIMLLPGHEQAATCGVFSTDGKKVFTGSGDGTIRVWNIENGRELHVIHGHNGPINTLSSAFQDRLLLSSSWDGTSRLWDLIGFDPMVVFPNTVYAQFSTGMPMLFSSRNDGRLECWEAAAWENTSTDITEHLAQSGMHDYAALSENLAPPTTPERVVVILSEETVSTILEQFSAHLRKSQNNPQHGTSLEGLTLDTEFWDAPLRKLGLFQGDTVLRVNDSAVNHDPHTLANSLETFVTSLKQNTQEPLTLTVLRENKQLDISLFTRPCQHARVDTPLPRNAALDCVNALMDRTIAMLYRQRSPDESLAARKRQARIPAQEGLQIQISTNAPATDYWMTTMHLSSYDLVVGLDERNLSDRDEALGRLQQLRADLENGTAKEFTLDVQRGEFKRIHLRYTVQ